MKKFTEKLAESISFKLFTIVVLVLLLLIPTAFVKSLIKEREATRNSVIYEISSKWGNQQTVTGPFITVPYYTYYKKDKEVIKQQSFAHFLPEQLNITGNLNPEIRYRGIYKVIVYNSELEIRGNFLAPSFKEWKVRPEDILWDEAYLAMGISDMRGIKDELKINFDNATYDVSPGVPNLDLISKGINSKIKLADKDSFDFNFKLNLNGSEALKFIPIGKTTNVEINSDWNTPSFDGEFLPDPRNVSDSGFQANWQVLQVNRTFPQKWTGSKYNIYDSQFGVKLLFPVDQYLKSFRAAKYAIMFIGLTFVVFFFSEILNKKRIHPIQYLLVGIAICVFYVLLISLAEHFGFATAYIVGGSATIGLITLFSKSVFKSTKLALMLMSILIALYTFLFTILQLQDYSLLLGSLGLFIVLGAIMYLSRKIDWYKPIQRDNNSIE
ncbi:MAG: cell envelope integrity protein CreD [Bacteroidia bacterium]|nr:cell envelope integrity protein CreD [Bacteroidia bacterium]